MEYIAKKKEKKNPFFSKNNYYKYNININNEEKGNFIISSKNNTIISIKRKKFIQKRQKELILYNSKKDYLYGILYNKLFLILNFFIIFFYISPAKQNPDVNELPKSEIIITINGPGIKSIFSDNFQNKPDIIFINENKTNLKEISDNRFEMNKEENIIRVYYSNPPDNLRNMFTYNNNIKKIDFSHFDTSKVTDMNNMFSNCNEFGIY